MEAMEYLVQILEVIQTNPFSILLLATYQKAKFGIFLKGFTNIFAHTRKQATVKLANDRFV